MEFKSASVFLIILRTFMRAYAGGRAPGGSPASPQSTNFTLRKIKISFG